MRAVCLWLWDAECQYLSREGSRAISLYHRRLWSSAPPWLPDPERFPWSPKTPPPLSRIYRVYWSRSGDIPGDVDQTPVYCWASVADADPTINRRLVNVSRLLGYFGQPVMYGCVTTPCSMLGQRLRRWPNIGLLFLANWSTSRPILTPDDYGMMRSKHSC